ncbi:MAG: gfo/Idh/MocA family oxidoreductase, partial [Oscillospiraceae bacterium]|nr:gfo/Idh/MocA family oxidoreductase [Oscillospiraceae bacterium]
MQTASDNSASVIGTDGFILFDSGFVWSCGVTLYDKNGIELDRFEYQNDINGYEYEIREAMRCLSEGLTESPLVKQCDTEAVMKIMDSCREQWGFSYPEE